jgi:hypothetical protein
MGELYNRTAWAAVEVVAGQATAAWNGLAAQATVTDRGPGLNQADAVQVAAELAALRDLVAAWGYAQVVGFPTGAPLVASQARLVETFGVTQLEDTANKMAQAGLDATFLVGDAPFIGEKWGRQLALALDRLLVVIGSAEQGPSEQAHVVPGFLPAAVLPLIVIVTGAALSIIASVATWRYLDPDVRRDGLLVRQAAEDYAARLQTFSKTGSMPAPSETEKSAVGTVERLAAARGGTDWGMGAAIAGGMTAGVLLLGVLGRRAA